MLVVLSGGGTAGHINPALAVAEVLLERGANVLFAGTPQGVEARLVREAGIFFKPFVATGFNRRHPLTLISGISNTLQSTQAAKRWFSGINPDVVAGFGGYVSIPVGRAAKQMGIPLVVHEQNSVMGLANKYLAKKASAVCLTYEQAKSALSDTSYVHITGNPVRASIFDATREEGRKLLGIPEEARLLLVFGGSQGARHINQAICAMKETLLSYDDLYVVHVTGPKELTRVQKFLSLTPVEEKRWQLFGYQNHMGAVMAAADVIVSRAGATSLAEISARAIPALLVPFPYATGDHQTTNARAYVEAGCAYMIPDAEVEGSKFKDLVISLVEDETVRASMTQAAHNLHTRDAAHVVADIIMRAADEKAL